MDVDVIEPIDRDWIPPRNHSSDAAQSSAGDAVRELARMDVGDLDATIVPLLAAAVAELAEASGRDWIVSGDPPVALVRILTTLARQHSMATGPETTRLVSRLRGVAAISAGARARRAAPVGERVSSVARAAAAPCPGAVV